MTDDITPEKAERILDAILGRDWEVEEAESWRVTADGYHAIRSWVHTHASDEYRRESPTATWAAIPWCIREIMLMQVEMGRGILILPGCVSAGGEDLTTRVVPSWRGIDATPGL